MAGEATSTAMHSGATGPVVDGRRSFVRITIPFSFDPERYRAATAAVDATTWRLLQRDHPTWEPLQLREEALLPNVVRQWRPGGNDAPARFWQVAAAALQSPSGLGAAAPWWVRTKPAPIPAELTRVLLACFASGAGSVTFELRPRGYAIPGDDGTGFRFRPDGVATWLELVRQLRFVDGGRAVEIVTAKTSPDTASVDELVGFPAVGGAVARPAGTLTDLARGLLVPLVFGPGAQLVPGIGDDEAVTATLDLPFDGFPFLALFVTGATEAQVRQTVLLARTTARTDRDAGSSAEELRLTGPGFIERRAGAWLYSSLMSAGFVGNDVPTSGYFAQFSGELRAVHHLGLVFALHQRQVLLRLIEEAGARWQQEDDLERVRTFQELTDRFHLLTARGTALQLFRGEGQHSYYEAVQGSLRIGALRDELRVTLADLTGAARLHLAEQSQSQQQRFERRVSAFALIFGVPSLVLAFLGVNIEGLTAPEPVPFMVALAFVVLAFLAGGAIGVVARRNTDRPARTAPPPPSWPTPRPARRPPPTPTPPPAVGEIQALGGGDAPRAPEPPPPSSEA